MARYLKVLDSASRTVDVASPSFDNWENSEAAMHLVVNISSGSPNLVVTVRGDDTLSDTHYAILTSATISASGQTILRVGPDYTAGTNIAKDYIPARWSVAVTQSGGVAATYSIGASVI